MKNQTKPLFEINPTCDQCGDELYRVSAGYVCIRGHGRITPVGVAQAECELPLNPDGAGRIRQHSLETKVRAFNRATRELDRIRQREQRERELAATVAQN